MASNSSFQASSPFSASWDVASSLSVMPPRALTTITTGCFLASFSTICLRLRILFTEPTDVPPNFNTFIVVFVCLLMLPIPRTNGVMAELGRKNTKNYFHDQRFFVEFV